MNLPFVIFACESTIDKFTNGSRIMNVIQNDHQRYFWCAGFSIDLIGQVREIKLQVLSSDRERGGQRMTKGKLTTKTKCTTIVQVWKSLSPCMTGGACWKWPRCRQWPHGRCGPPGTQPAGRRGSSYPSRSVRTGWDGGVWVADWCSVASWVWEWGFQIPGCPHISPSNLDIVREKWESINS